MHYEAVLQDFIYYMCQSMNGILENFRVYLASWETRYFISTIFASLGWVGPWCNRIIEFCHLTLRCQYANSLQISGFANDPLWCTTNFQHLFHYVKRFSCSSIFVTYSTENSSFVAQPWQGCSVTISGHLLFFHCQLMIGISIT